MATRKTQAKKANAPMKNAPKKKAPAKEAKAAAASAARTMAKTVKTAGRKSAAKRVEKIEKKVVVKPADDFAAVKKQANRIIAVIRDDCANAAANGKAGEEKARELVKALSRTLLRIKEKQGVKAD